MAEGRDEIVSLQAVRAVAATAVVCHHAFRAATIHRPSSIYLLANAWQPSERWVNLGALGVDLFFVLSGFLMVHISDPYFRGARTTGHFLTKRFIRIWPLYAVFTTYVLARAAWEARPNFGAAFDLQPLRLASYAFVPSFDQNGLVAPPVGVGWTLTYEVLFYLCFAAVITLRPKRPLILLGSLLALLYVVGLIIPNSAVHVLLNNDILFEFLIGAWIGSMVGNGWLPTKGWRWIAAAGATLALLCFASNWIQLPRLIKGGVPATLAFIGAIALNQTTRFPSWVIKLGDASYSLYLSHIFIAGAVVNRILPYVADGRIGLVAIPIAAVSAIFLCCIVGLVVHVWVEKPLLHFFLTLENRFTKYGGSNRRRTGAA